MLDRDRRQDWMDSCAGDATIASWEAAPGGAAIAPRELREAPAIARVLAAGAAIAMAALTFGLLIAVPARLETVAAESDAPLAMRAPAMACPSATADDVPDAPARS